MKGPSRACIFLLRSASVQSARKSQRTFPLAKTRYTYDNHSQSPSFTSRAFPYSASRKTSRQVPPPRSIVSLPAFRGLKQLFYYKPLADTRHVRLSSVGSPWTAAVVFCTLALLYSVIPAPTSSIKTKSHTPHEILESIEAEISNMTGEALPGRPGTLTAEQEEKLREFWMAIFQIFGVLDAKDLQANGSAVANGGPARSETVNSKKPKKKRLGLFRRGGKDDDSDSVTSTESGYHYVGTDADDKYGQTKEYHDALSSLSPEELRSALWSMVKHDHPDALLLRFLRARKWDIEKALVMMISTMRWRLEVHVDDDIMARGELAALEEENGSDPTKKKVAHDFLTQMRMGKSFLHGSDKEGRPMCYVRVRLHRQGEQCEESLERYTVYLIESARMVLAPPVDTACLVFDMTGFSLANMDYAPVKFMIKCFEANYPESLGVVLVHKAPWVFQGIWKIIKGWLDPVVAAKVLFTNNNEEMAEYVPHSHIIKELGGEEDWVYNYVEPVPGENDLMKDTETRDRLLQEREVVTEEFEKATLEWVQKGTDDATATKKIRNELAVKLREGYWQLDPYLRAKSHYDREGMISHGGKINFYPCSKIENQPPITNGIKAMETTADDVD